MPRFAGSWPLVAALALLVAAPSEASAQTRVVLVGDSITFGAVSGGGTPYADVLSLVLGGGWTVINEGCGGSTSNDWDPGTPAWPFCAAIATEVLPHLPADFVTILLGTNDATGYYEPEPNGTPVPVPTYAAHLQAIVAELQAHGAGKVVLMTPPPRCATAPQDIRDRLAGYRAEVLLACITTPGLVCGPDVHALLDPVADFDACNVHPNATGHAKIGLELASTLQNLPACSDGLDNDGDGLIDFGSDPGCASNPSDAEDPACNDGVDNDGDGATDFPADAGCPSAAAGTENPRCDDGLDNDGDGLVDLADPQCASVFDDTEGCGLGGPEILLAFVAIGGLRRLRRRSPRSQP